MKNIFDQMTLNGLTLKNRLWRSATWLALADDDGNLTAQLIERYQELAAGGIGAIITGITTVSPHDSLLDGIAKFHSDRFIEQHKELTSTVHQFDCKIFMQTAIVDSVFYVDDQLFRIPINNLTVEHIKEIIDLFTAAAVRAKNAGYDGIQLHVAHFFFLSKFISPAFNQRDDEYGGNPKARAKILADILDSIRAEVGKNFPVIAKINGDDFTDGGMTLHDCIEACRVMVEHGIDAIEISGNYTSRDARPHANEGYFQKYAVGVKERVDVPIILVGGHRSIEDMNWLINKTAIEFLSMSRPLIREPDLINRWQRGDIRPSTCVACNACYRTPGHRCIFKGGH